MPATPSWGARRPRPRLRTDRLSIHQTVLSPPSCSLFLQIFTDYCDYDYDRHFYDCTREPSTTLPMSTRSVCSAISSTSEQAVAPQMSSLHRLTPLLFTRCPLSTDWWTRRGFLPIFTDVYLCLPIFIDFSDFLVSALPSVLVYS